MTTQPRALSPWRQPLLRSDKAGEGRQLILESHEYRSPSRLLFFNEIPSWQQENEFILTGYR